MISYFSRKNHLFCILFITVVLFPVFSKSIGIDKKLRRITPEKYIEYLEDKSKTLTFDDVVSPDFQTKWLRPLSNSMHFGFSDSAYWMRFTVVNNENEPIDFILEHLVSQEMYLDLYIVDGTSVNHISSGLYLPFKKRVYRHRNFVFPMNIPAKSSVTYYIRHKSSFPISLLYVLWSPEAFNTTSAHYYYFFILFYGILLALSVYNLIIFFFVRRIEYLYFVIITIGIIVSQSVVNGTGSQFLWPAFPHYSPYIHVTLLDVITIFYILFLIKQLMLKKNLPVFYYIGIVILISRIIFIPVGLLLSLKAIYPLNAVNGLIAGVFAFVCSVIMVFKKNRTAYFFFFANFALQIGNVMLVLLSFNIVPGNFFLVYSNYFAYIIYVTFYALSLADRINVMRSDLAVLNAGLEEKVKDRTIKLHDANERLKELDRLKSNFFANISHEIRTPLTLILGPVESALQEGSPSELDKEFLQSIKRNAHRLLRLINNILDFSKLEAKKVKLIIREVDVGKMIHGYLGIIASALEAKEIKLVITQPDTPVMLFIDREKIGTVFMNIFSNALKFSERGGKITVGITNDDDFCRIMIADTGPGIAADKIDTIFDRFSQADSSASRSYEGTGIGLSLANELISLHNGDISVESRYIKDFPEDHGTVFTLSIPQGKAYFEKRDNVTFITGTVDNSPGAGDDWNTSGIREIYDLHLDDKARARVQTEVIGGRNTVLIVEDNHDLLRYLTHHVSREYNVYTAQNGKHALKVLKEMQKPDIILSDIMMPDMDGFEFYTRLSENDVYNDIPFIFLSARTGIDEKVRGLSKGAIDYIYKPFYIDEVLAKIKSIIKNETLKQALYEKEKLAALGMLTGGLCHEILNPLHMIYGPVDLLEMELKNSKVDNETIKEYLDKIIGNVERIEKVVKDLNFFAEINDADRQKVNLNRIIENIKKRMVPALPREIEFLTEVHADIELYVNPEALEHILQNLLENAVDAVKDKGIIKIYTERTDENEIIRITDTGQGIKQESLPRIFDAFFTEKEVGDGVGLGLYMVKELLVKEGWIIDVQSTLDEGTQFMITIPAHSRV